MKIVCSSLRDESISRFHSPSGEWNPEFQSLTENLAIFINIFDPLIEDVLCQYTEWDIFEAVAPGPAPPSPSLVISVQILLVEFIPIFTRQHFLAQERWRTHG